MADDPLTLPAAASSSPFSALWKMGRMPNGQVGLIPPFPSASGCTLVLQGTLLLLVIVSITSIAITVIH
jgi:hypothetical protein